MIRNRRPVPHFDRYDVLAAHYFFYATHHEGMGSDKYARLCRVQRVYEPSSEVQFGYLTENARAIYDRLVEGM